MDCRIVKKRGSFEKDGKKIDYVNYYVVVDDLMLQEKISIPKDNIYLKELFLNNLEAVAVDETK